MVGYSFTVGLATTEHEEDKPMAADSVDSLHSVDHSPWGERWLLTKTEGILSFEKQYITPLHTANNFVSVTSQQAGHRLAILPRTKPPASTSQKPPK